MNPPLVYIAGPFTAPTRVGIDRNIYHANLFAVEVAKAGAMPVTPHALTASQEFETAQPYEFWLAATLELCRVCHAILLIPGWESSRGARGEAIEMQRLDRPIFYDVEDVADWVKARAA